MPLALPAEAADYSNLYINEICTQNKECLLDSYGTASDWIEFYNAADESLALDGLGVTDDAANPMKWTFPSGVTIAAHSYLVVFASKQASTATEYHTGFALSKSGETVTLSSADGTTLQQVAVPALAEDQTYGRSSLRQRNTGSHDANTQCRQSHCGDGANFFCTVWFL